MRQDSGMVRMQGVEVATVDEFKFLGSTVQRSGVYSEGSVAAVNDFFLIISFPNLISGKV